MDIVTINKISDSTLGAGTRSLMIYKFYQKGDIVTAIDRSKNTLESKKSGIDYTKNLTVDKAYLIDLGDIITQVIHFVDNPKPFHLSNYFKPADDKTKLAVEEMMKLLPSNNLTEARKKKGKCKTMTKRSKPKAPTMGTIIIKEN